jgi:hypothetical protein
MGSAASTSLSLPMKKQRGKRKIENAHPSAGYVHCSVPIEDPKHDTCDSETFKESDVLEHYAQLCFVIQEVSNAGPNHSLISELKEL